ncbi:MAG: hypothetical protein AAFV25_19585, partial [Bacteroidota bacterium]
MNPSTSLDTTKDYSRFLFFGILLSYCWQYAPFGINETDGGFITAYAWRILQGEWPYQDFIYVRPPGSLWIRALEMQLLPTNWAILGERCLFYGKMAVVSYLGARMLLKGSRVWWAATLGFVLSVHNYPAAAWHTVDGILFSVLALYLASRSSSGWLLGGICALLAMLCKQSFYPLLAVWVTLVLCLWGWRKGLVALLWLVALWGLFLWGMQWMGLLADYLHWTSGASSLQEALQRGVVDYVRLHPVVLATAVFLVLAFVGQERGWSWHSWTWHAFLLSVMAIYVWRIYQNQDFTVPIKESRWLFLLAVAWLLRRLFLLWQTGLPMREWAEEGAEWMQTAALLSVAWMASISWGYNFPILYSLPVAVIGIWMGEEMGGKGSPWLRMLFLLLLLLVFRFAYHYVYRDGVRTEMSCQLESVFPKLKGVRSSEATCDKYRSLAKWHQRYGDCYSVLPSFPLAHYLTDSQNPLPLDWVIRPEYNGQASYWQQVLDEFDKSCVLLLERSYEEDQLQTAKFEITQQVREGW